MTTVAILTIISVGIILGVSVWYGRNESFAPPTNMFDSENRLSRERYLKALRLLREVHRIARNDGPEGVLDHGYMDEAELMLTFEADKLEEGYKR